MSTRGRRLLLAFLALCLIGVLLVAIAGGLWMRRKNAVDGFTERTTPMEMTAHPLAGVVQAFTSPAGTERGLGRAPYDAAGGYLLEGFLSYRTGLPSLVSYPGEPSWNGRHMDEFEAYARILPFAAAWLAAGGEDGIATAAGTVSLTAALRDGLIAGTDPDDPGYWGEPGRFDQRVVEAADVALGVWLARDRLWPMLDPTQQGRVLAWLRAAANAEVFPGMWQLFPVLVERVADALGGSSPQLSERARTGYERFLTLYRGDGWYFDMPKGFDYYNAWGIHYALFWIDQVDPDWDSKRIRERLVEFASFFRHLFGPQGVPIMGRSLCYRLAVPAPLVAASLVAPAEIAPGEAMRALDATWSYYVGRGALEQGRITQGICGDDLALLDGYSGPASCLWSLRSLVVAYYAQARQPMFDIARQPLPVEQGDFSVSAAAPGWTVEGSKADGQVRLRLAANAGNQPAPLRAPGLRNRLQQWLVQAPRRPDNTAALYLRPEYTTAEPVSACRPAR